MNVYNDDISFLRALRQGTPEAFDRLYALYYRPLCYFAEGLIRNIDIAQDIATESFIKLLQKSTNFDSTEGLKSFLYRITRNACYDYLRANRRHENSHEEIRYLAVEQNDNGEVQMIRTEVLHTIYLAIEQLPQKYRGAIKLALLEGKKNEEIANDLKLSPQTVRNRKSEGLRLLRIALVRQRYLLHVVVSCFF